MTGCTYKLKNIDGSYVTDEQGNPIELNAYQMMDKLQEMKLLKNYGLDIVFNTSPRDSVVSSLVHIARNKNKDIEFEYQKSVLEVADDVEPLVPKTPHTIGVTKFLSGLRKKSSGDLLFPEFIEENYWNEMFQTWDQEGFDNDTKEILFEKDEKGNFIEDPNLTKEEAKAFIKERWQQQAEIGNAVHKGMELFFRYDKNLKQTVRSLSDAEIRDYIRTKYSEEFSKLIGDNVIDKIIQQGRIIMKSLGDDGTKEFNYFPEFKISSMTTNKDEDGSPIKLVGIIDLLVVDDEGNLHLIDYKTSTRKYGDPKHTAKQRAYKYQIATYVNLLQQNGISIKNLKTYVQPIRIENLKKVNGKWQFDDLVLFNNPVQINFLEESYIQENVQEFLPKLDIVDTTPEKVMETWAKFRTRVFGEHYDYGRKADREKITEMVEEKATKNDDTGKWSLQYFKEGYPFVAESKAKLVEKIVKTLESDPIRRHETTMAIKQKIRDAIQSYQEGDYKPITFESYNLRNPVWLGEYLSQYTTGQWIIQDTPEIIEAEGIILLKNKETNQLDVIVISDKLLSTEFKLDKGDYITGQHSSNIEEDSNTESLAYKATEGYIEMIKAGVMLNQMPNLFANNTNGVIGNIRVVNPKCSEAMSSTNEAFLYNWKQLSKHCKDILPENRIASGEFKLATQLELLTQMFTSILSMDSNISKNFEKFKAASADIEHITQGNTVELRSKLVEILNLLESEFPGIDKIQDSIQHPEAALYRQVLLAISEVDGIKMDPIYKDGHLLLDSVKIISDGLSGLETDNPGNLLSKSLNALTKLVMQTYQNVRDNITKKIPQVRKLTEALEQEKGYTGIRKATYGNATSMYINMIYQDSQDGDIYVKNPWDETIQLSTAERNFLKHFLIEINKGRHPDKVEKLDTVTLNSHDSFFRLPLLKGDSKSAIALNGLGSALKQKLEQLSPKHIAEAELDKIQGINNDARNDEDIIWEMTTQFDASETDDGRAAILQKHPMSYFELNLETLLYKHMFAYTTKAYMDDIFADLKAITFYIKGEQFTRNTKFKDIETYIEHFIKAKVQRQSIDPQRWDVPKAYMGKVMGVASKLALAFNPRQLYQAVEGIFKDISLAWRTMDTDDDQKFTLGQLTESFFSTLPEMVTFKSGRTKWEALNQLYGINDMGINEYADRIKSDKYGFLASWNRWMFKFASRPDFYNRATIFGAQMRRDGCWEAHEFTENGELIYHPEMDERFKAFILEDHSDEAAYNNARGLYIAVGKQMMKERTRNADGSLFNLYNKDGSINKNLPKAYSAQQSDSHKDVADTYYGYYAEERKALIQSYGIGAMLMQMNTYWSSKKNQWLAPGGVKLQGKMVQYEEPILNENGEKTGQTKKFFLTKDGESFVPEGDENASAIPYMVWRGDYNEGIILTLYKMKTMGIWEVLKIDDEQLRKAYRANLRQFGYDCFMTVVFGMIIANRLVKNYAEGKIKESPNPIAQLGYNTFSSILSASLKDFNPIESIGGRGMNWTPFALSQISKVWNTWVRILDSESSSVMDGCINTFGFSRTLKYPLKYIEETITE